MVRTAFNKKDSWGPRLPHIKENWRQFKNQAKEERNLIRKNWFQHIAYSLVGAYRWKAVLPKTTKDYIDTKNVK